MPSLKALVCLAILALLVFAATSPAGAVGWPPAKAIGDERVRLLKGTPQQVQQFFSYFDRKPTTIPSLSNR